MKDNENEDSPQTNTLKGDDPISILNELRNNNFVKIIIGHLNINSLRNKFEALKSMIQGYVDIFVISETKINESVPSDQFKIDGYSTPLRVDRNMTGGVIIIYIRSDIPHKVLTPELPNDVEGLFIEFNLRNKKWVLFAGYNPKKERISHFLNNIGTSLDKFIEKFENLLLIGDFNSVIEEENMKKFCEVYNLQNLIKEPTCFKSIQNPTSIVDILTNRCKYFHSSCTIETGLSDHHKMTITVLKTYYKKLKPAVISYRSYKDFDEINFKEELSHILYASDIGTMKYEEFKSIF